MAMHLLLDMLRGLIAFIAVSTLSWFGVEMHMPRAMDREIERVQICPPDEATAVKAKPNKAC